MAAAAEAEATGEVDDPGGGGGRKREQDQRVQTHRGNLDQNGGADQRTVKLMTAKEMCRFL